MLFTHKAEGEVSLYSTAAHGSQVFTVHVTTQGQMWKLMGLKRFHVGSNFQEEKKPKV